MKPVDQTLFGKGDGNCYQACLASILEVPLDAVPHFCCAYDEDTWFTEVQRWLAPRGLGIAHIDAKIGPPRLWEAPPNMCHIITGPGHRGLLHAVVGRDGEMIHDPHPSREGLREPEIFEIFVCLDPAKEV